MSAPHLLPGSSCQINLSALGMDRVDGMVAAVGDADGDQLLDLFVLSSDQRTITVWSWDRTRYTFAPSGAPPIHAPFVVANVVPTDLDADGRLDLLLMGQTSPGGYSDRELKMVVCRGIGARSFAEPVEIPASTLAQPLVFDAQGDMRGDLLAVPAGDTRLRMWNNTFGGDSAPFTLCVDRRCLR